MIGRISHQTNGFTLLDGFHLIASCSHRSKIVRSLEPSRQILVLMFRYNGEGQLFQARIFRSIERQFHGVAIHHFHRTNRIRKRFIHAGCGFFQRFDGELYVLCSEVIAVMPNHILLQSQSHLRSCFVKGPTVGQQRLADQSFIQIEQAFVHQLLYIMYIFI